MAAIILEANLIKTYLPFYNSAVKDDKSVSYITIADFPKPIIKIVHGSDIHLKNYKNPKTQIYGPFINGIHAQIILKVIRRVFGYCANPDNPQKRSCFYFHIRQCPGYCNGLINQSEYKKHLSRIKSFLSGRFLYLIDVLTKQIKDSAKNEDFETAAALKTQLEGLNTAIYSRRYSKLLTLPAPVDTALEKAILMIHHPLLKSVPTRIECYDMANMGQEDSVGSMVVFEHGKPEKDNYRKFIVRTDKKGDPHTMAHILKRRLRHDEWPKPDLIILDGGVPQLSIVSKVIPKDIPVIALSKKRETLHFYNTEGLIENVNLPLHNAALKIFQFARDEAHRFGTTFHKQRRSKRILRDI